MDMLDLVFRPGRRPAAGLLDGSAATGEGNSWVSGNGPDHFTDLPAGLYARNGMDVASDNAAGPRAYSNYDAPLLPGTWQHVATGDKFIDPRRRRAVEAARAADVLRDFQTFEDPANNNVMRGVYREIRRPPVAQDTVREGYQPTSTSSPNGGVHRLITRRQSQLSPDQLDREEAATYGIDEQQDVQVPHYMRLDDGSGTLEPPQAARERFNAWVRFNLQRAWDYEDQRNPKAAWYHLGLAKHAVQDMASPPHNDTSGAPDVWHKNGRWLDKLLHVSREMSDPGPGSWAQRATNDIQRMFETRYVPEGDLSRMYGIDAPDGPVDRPGQYPAPLPVPEPGPVVHPGLLDPATPLTGEWPWRI